MVIGYDTYHDARQRKAVGAFVASINPTFSRYYSSVKIHENNEEISPSFKDHLFGALKYVLLCFLLCFVQDNISFFHSIIAQLDPITSRTKKHCRKKSLSTVTASVLETLRD